MIHRLARSVLWLAAVCLVSASAETFAARVISQPRNGYERTSFTFEQPTQLKVSNGGNTMVLNFSTPLKQSPDAIAASLKGVVKSASISPDGKKLTLSLARPYRTRHFVSGNTVGVDFITPTDDKPAPEPTQIASAETKALPEPKQEPLLTTKKPVKKEEPKKEEKKAAPPEKKPTQAVAPAKQPATVVKPAPPEPKAAEKPKAPAKEAEPEILTTKKSMVEVIKAEPKPESAKPVVAAPAAKPEKPAEQKPVVAEKPAPVTVAEEKPVPVADRKMEAPVAKPATKPSEEDAKPVETKGPFAVTIRNVQNNSILNFPYKERTAAAVFERGNDIWMIFSRSQNLNVEQLKTILPKTVRKAEQYSMRGNSVLRLTTDGSVHAAAQNVKNSYQWNVTLSGARTEPANLIGISTENNSGKNYLLVKAFDVAPSLSFYDPEAGDMLLVTPSYESSHGVSKGRIFPEFAVLPSAQGIAIASNRDDLNTNSSRQGLAVEGHTSLALSQNLATIKLDNTPMTGLDSGVLLPYDAWYVPTNQFIDTLQERQQALSNATKDSRAEVMLSLVSLYLGRGMGTEALGYLDLLKANEPEFYKNKKLALLATAAHSLEGHMDAAAIALASPELAEVKEADAWREYLGLFVRKANEVQQATQSIAGAAAAPTPPPSMADDREETSEAPPAEDTTKPAVVPTGPIMRFLKYNRSYIRFYPPRIRQMLVSAAANAYIANGLEEKALAAFDTLNRDEILGPLKEQAEYALALASSKQKKPDITREALTRLIAQNDDPRSRARARATLAMMELQAGTKTPTETEEELEQARMGWHGDAVEVDILKTLTKLYKENKQYDEALRSMKTLIDEFPGESDFLTSSGELSDFFQELYFKGAADEMSPLKALALFYEFKDLTPVGDKGDMIIQKLADRLAAIDLIDRATQLLENQISFRLSGEDRSRVGARLSLLYIVNHQPQEAIKVLEITNYGNNSPELQRQRLQLTAQALSAQGRNADALNMIYNDNSDAGNLLRLDILWAAQDWPNVVTTAEDILSKRADLTAPLTNTETEVLLKLALGYSFQGDYTQLRYLRDYYLSLIPDSAYKSIFEFITNDTNPLDREDSAMLTEQISHTESFLNTFKAKIANGKLSEAVK